MAAGALALNAVPARRAYFQYPQPDGSTVTAMPVGDEFGHYYLSTDGKALMADNSGVLRYVAADAGKLVLSDMAAADPQQRDAGAEQFLRRADREKVEEAISLRARDVRANRAAAAAATRKAPAKASEAPQYGIGLFTNNYPRTGEVKSLVFLVEYQDVKFTTANAHDVFTRQLNESGYSDYGATGSARDYFLKQSDSIFNPHFDVFGPVTLPQNRSYYGANDAYGNDRNPQYMMLHAAELLKNEIDFSEYDLDNDGYVDNIYIIYAGMGEANGGSAETVWPHSFQVGNSPSYNGKRLRGYACSNEVFGGAPDGIGTFCHEYSHVLGLPDLYGTQTQFACTPNEWDIMDQGSYNNNSHTPPNYSSFERNALRWMKPVIVDASANVTLHSISDSNTAYLIPTRNNNEFFLLENRQKKGWDAYIPGHGLLIWHIDFNQLVWDNNSVNNIISHQRVDIEEACGNVATNFAGRAAYTFPGTNRVTSFTAETTPSLTDWNGNAIDHPITDIAENSGVISFHIGGTKTAPEVPAGIRITPYTAEGRIEISWNAVSDAQSYEVCIYTKTSDGTENIFGGYKDYSTGSATSISIDRLQPDTEYFARVRARNAALVSEYSAEVMTNSGDIDFIHTAPVATGCTFDGGKALLSWQPLHNAATYLVTVEKESALQDSIAIFTFGEHNDRQATIPEGWNWSESPADCYTADSDNFYGEDAPSLKFPVDNAFLESPVFGENIKNVSFWLRSVTGSFKNKFHICGRNSAEAPYDTIYTIERLNTLNGGGKIHSIEMPDSIRQIRFSLERYGGSAVIDDLSLTLPVYTFSDYLSRTEAGAALHYTLEMPEGATGLRFTVEAKDADGNLSMPSRAITARTSHAGESNIENISTGNVSLAVQGTTILYQGSCGDVVSVFGIAGNLVATLTADTSGSASVSLPAGFYIARTPRGSFKTIIR